ncbi:nucleotidyltransferase domain-containing protein [Proteus vulgaris]|uniref:nucleotidyltransferase domain-containing protein n=1 Tax=Proteus vulgaris TaxID=585 RepID=UPI0021B093CE|nr:nucleotidyltransferase domain-containing protein [Proteus vulgaris]MCT6516118.1 nucleotidyltransferase domain-containing protein [Proteus vulgaris]
MVSGYSPENNPKNEIRAESIKLKKWFYMLRSLLSAYWTVKTGDIPPMELSELIKILTVEEQNAIKELVDFKSDKNEHFTWIPTEAMQHLVIFLWQETNIHLTNRTVPDNDILNNWVRNKLDETDY